MTVSQPVTTASPGASLLTRALSTGRIPGLDFLRALAVLFVLADHSGVIPEGIPNVMNGAIGVEIFFVLSGFLITWMLLGDIEKQGRIHLGDFYRRRFARLMPVFYTYVLLGMAALYLTHKTIPWGAVGTSLVYVLNYYQGLHGAQTHFLSHCWSLAVEEQFYFLWPFALMLMLRAGHRLDKSIAVIVLCVWIYRAALYQLGLASDEYLYRALETRADHLLIGCLLAVGLRRPQAKEWIEHLEQKAPWLPILPALVLIGSGALDGNLHYRYTFGYIIEPLAAAALIPLVIIRAKRNEGVLARCMNASLVVKMGQASYGIYLFHQLLLYSLRTRIEAFTGSFALGFLAAVAILSVLAHLSYTRFEMPLRQWLNHRA
ncbi:MAG: acyltransferase [Aquabacterium sp.]|uniref:acyltransferase family protein n=1 Tax=Aquabacterium sp. TaxID=1872578 RepID=UPI0025BB9095|nr:acyltransferase [Aquabacterium sp.]MBI3382756.1 acyltransferase [Aquabacterium sp.]